MDLKTELFNIYRSEDFPEYDDFMHLLEKALNLLENENSLYRPKEKYGEKFSGGLLDFCSEKKFGKETRQQQGHDDGGHELGYGFQASGVENVIVPFRRALPDKEHDAALDQTHQII